MDSNTIVPDALVIKNTRKESHSTGPATFEDAIAATGFGKYNYFLLATATMPCMIQLLLTNDLAYILPVAQCDLDLTLEDRGLVNAMVFAGMITSGMFWGFICDSLGRKKLIIYGYITAGIFTLIASTSMNKYVLIATKFMTGLIFSGPLSASTSHIIEFHSTKYRGLVNVIRGVFFSVGNIMLPILAWAFLTRKWNINIFDLFVLHSWNVMLLVIALCVILTGLIYTIVPESPKFLMTSGRNEEALRLFRKIFAANTGKSEDEYPIKQLEEEVINDGMNKLNAKAALKEGFLELGKIFKRPYINYLLLACSNSFLLVMSMNTIKLWLPGIFQAMSDYQNTHNGIMGSMCDALEEIQPQNVSSAETCIVEADNLFVYLNTFIVAATRILVFAVSGTFIRLIGVRNLNIIACYLGGILLFLIYFTTNTEAITALSAIGISMGSVGENLLITLTLELFPTSLRTTAVSIHLTLGRTGTLMGNLIFPYLIRLGCLPSLAFLGILPMVCASFSFMYSSVKNNPLK